MSDNKKINKTHMLSDIIYALLIYGAIMVVMYKTDTIERISCGAKNVSSDILSIWATILGFLITAMSILLTVKNTKYIRALKKSGHFQTLLRVFIESCFIITGLIFCVLMLKIIYISNIFIWQIVIFLNILGIIKVCSCLNIFLKIVDLSNDNQE